MGDLTTLRKILRERRKLVTGKVRAQASMVAADYVMQYLISRPVVRTVGIFLSLPEEIDTTILIQKLWQAQYEVCLPVVVKKDAPLQWEEYYPDIQLSPDAQGILAPVLEKNTYRRNIVPEFVIMPLVGYDKCGNRLGMGGGYYDRSFAGKIRGQAPWLVGFAYACQAVEELPIRPWDVPMDALANEHTLLRF